MPRKRYTLIVRAFPGKAGKQCCCLMPPCHEISSDTHTSPWERHLPYSKDALWAALGTAARLTPPLLAPGRARDAWAHGQSDSGTFLPAPSPSEPQPSSWHGTKSLEDDLGCEPSPLVSMLMYSE